MVGCVHQTIPSLSIIPSCSKHYKTFGGNKGTEEAVAPLSDAWQFQQWGSRLLWLQTPLQQSTNGKIRRMEVSWSKLLFEWVYMVMMAQRNLRKESHRKPGRYFLLMGLIGVQFGVLDFSARHISCGRDKSYMNSLFGRHIDKGSTKIGEKMEHLWKTYGKYICHNAKHM